MIDINRIRNNKEEIEKALLKRMDNINLDELLALDKEKRKIGALTDEYKAQRRRVSDAIPQMKKEGKNIEDTVAEMKKGFISVLKSKGGEIIDFVILA